MTAAMWPNCRSRGVATEEAIVSGLAPGSAADTEMVGKSTCGSGDTGSSRKATAPESAIATVSSVVAIGLRMKISDMFIALIQRARALQPHSQARQVCRLRCTRFAGCSASVSSRELPDDGARSGRQPVEEQINDRRRIKRQQLAQDQSADDRDAQRPPQFRARARAEAPAAIRPAARPSSSS